MPLSLPTKPSGDQYEDLIVAALKSLGYFTEPRLVLREGKKEVLELDVIATPVGEGPESRVLFEAKREGYSFPTIFKVFGQRTYLRIPSACIASMMPCDPTFEDTFHSKAREMNVRISHYSVSTEDETTLAPAANELDVETRSRSCGVIWYQQIARRIAYAEFIHECKSRANSETHKNARAYDLAVQASYFLPSPLARAEALYGAYMQAPRLVGEFVTTISATEDLKEQTVWNRLNDTRLYPWIQALMLIEHSARIAIVKNALDDVITRGDAPLETQTLRIGETTLEWPTHALPQRFMAGLSLLKSHKHSLRLPYLFQTFVEVFGGFLFFKDDDELTLLSQMVGIPPGELISALKVLDQFFPPPAGTWFFTIKDTILCMRMIPGFVRGGGSLFRRFVFRFADYKDKYPSFDWLLGKWHNALYFILEPLLAKDVVEDTPPPSLAA